MALVSIIMPVYNVEKYIERCIQSILNQTYKEFELIIVNDGSPDKSINIANNYKKLDNRIYIINKENGGLSDARNVGLTHARGKYILFLDSDDYIEKSLLEETVMMAEKNDAEVVMFGYYVDYCNVNEEVWKQDEVLLPTQIYNREKLKDIVPEKNFLKLLGYAWNKLYKYEFLMENQAIFTKGLSLIEDINFNAPLLGKVNKLVILEKALYHYIQRDRETLGNTYYKDCYELQCKVNKLREDMFKEWNIDENKIRGVLIENHIGGIRYSFFNIFYTKNQLSLGEKYREVRNMLKDDLTQRMIKDYHASTLKDKVFKGMVEYKLILLLCLVYYLKKL